MLTEILFIYVGYRICRTTVAIIRAIFIYWIAPLFYKPNLTKYVDRWTVVTGGTDGIGKAYTIELARRGLKKFVLIGRNQTKLDDVKSLLEGTYGCNVKTYLFDFYKDDYEALRQYISQIDIGFVLNSVGVGREKMERFGDNPEADRQILKVNAVGAAEFISMVLPPMEKCGGGQIVVVSSCLSIRPVPYVASYSAAKSLLSFLCEAVDREYSTVSIQCLTPSFVATKMVYYKEASLFVLTPEQFAKQAVNTIGLIKRTSGCFNHEIQSLVHHLFPWTILKYLLIPISLVQQRRVERLLAKAKQAN